MLVPCYISQLLRSFDGTIPKFSIAMKKLGLLLLSCLAYAGTQAQNYFLDDFDSYSADSCLGNQSTQWTTWSSNDCGSDDVNVVSTKAHSGSNSLYFVSASGNGPQDVVLDFGGVHSTGRFKYTAWYYIPANREAYFNFQGGAFTGSLWSLEFYFYNGGTFSAQGYGLTGSYPQDQWFEFVVDCDFDNDVWEFFIDGVSKGTITNSNPVSYLDLFQANGGSEWWNDDISFCINNACNPELALDSLEINPSTVCTHHGADVTFKVTNNSTFKADAMVLALDVAGVRTTQNINLGGLPGGADTFITVQGLFKSTVAGAAINVQAINLQGDVNAANDTAFATVTVNPSPSGAYISKGTPYQSGRPNSTGTMADPDVVTAGETITFQINPPVGFANTGYGSTWNIGSLSYYTVNGTAVNPAYFNFTAASGSSSATLSVTPDTLIMDSALYISFAVNDLANGCDTVMGRYVNVVPRPRAGFSWADVCDKVAMSFSNNSTIQSGLMTYTWSFGDGSSTTLQNPSHTYSAFGTYDVTLKAISDYGYVDSVTHTVEVFELPMAEFSIQNACEGSSLSFNDQSYLPNGTPSYAWDFGDGSPLANGNTPSYQYAQPGSYTVTMIVSINGCSDSRSHFATQAPRAVPSFTSQTSCTNSNAVFTNTSTVAFGTFGSDWHFGDGSTSGQKNPSHLYGIAGNIDVTLVVTTDLNCVDSVINTITLIEAPEADFALSNACSNEDIILNNLSTAPANTGNTYAWLIANSTSSSATSPMYNFGAAGSYTVKLVVNNSNGCKDSVLRNVHIDTKPIAGYVASNVCDGEEVNFLNNTKNTAAGVSYVWDFGNGTQSAAVDTSFAYAGFGSYDVSLLALTQNGCSDTITKQVEVYELPNANFNVGSALTADGQFLFSGPVGTGYTYKWLLSDGSKYSARDFNHTFVLSGVYTIRLIVTSPEGCVSETTQTINSTPNSVGSMESAGIQIYPNPTSNRLNIDLSNSDVQSAFVQVFDISGKMVLNTAISGTQQSLDVSAMSAGTYTMRIATSNEIYSSKFQIIR